MRDDVGFPDSEIVDRAIYEALFELENPEIHAPLTKEHATEIIATLRRVWPLPGGPD